METKHGQVRVVAGMPMYNEEETIGTVVTMALRHVDEVICIDDGSSDSSARIAEACGATVIRHRGNQGYGAALKTLFKATRDSDADILVVLDSDGQHDTADIPKLIQPILDEEADFTIGSRFVEGGEGNDMPAYRRLGIKVITAASNLTSDLGIKDTQSGFRAFSRKAIDRLRFDADGMELSLEMLEDAKEKQLTIQEIPTIIRYDVPKGSNFTAILSRIYCAHLGTSFAFTKETIVDTRHSRPWTPRNWSSNGHEYGPRIHDANRYGSRPRIDCRMDWCPRIGLDCYWIHSPNGAWIPAYFART